METTLNQELMKRIKENGTFIIQQSKPLPASALQLLTPQMEYLLQRYPTPDVFFRVFNVRRQVYICQNPASCILGLSPTLTQLDIMYGAFTSVKWLIPFIADASLNCGLKEDASEDQLLFIATAMSSRYKWMKAGELMQFFFNFKAGFYERFYSYFDPQTIIRSMPSFLHERQQIIEVNERELKEKEAEKDRVPGISLEKYNIKYGPTETLNRMLKSNN